MEITRKGFLNSLGLLLVLNAIIKPVWLFGIDRQVQNEVGTEVYGSYFALFNLSIIFSFFLDAGVSTFLNREVARGKDALEIFPRVFFMKIILLLLYIIIVISFAHITGVSMTSVLCYVITIQCLTSFFIFLRSYITSIQLFNTDALLSILDKTLLIILCGAFLYLPFNQSLTLDLFLQLQVGTLTLSVLSAFFIIANHSGKSLISFVLPGISFLKQALPYGLIVFLMSIHYRADGFLLERLSPGGAREAGIYAGAYRLLDGFNMGGFLVSGFLLPFIARNPGSHMVSDVVRVCRHFLIAAAIFFSITVIFLAPWLQDILYHNEDPNAVLVMQWAIPSLFGYSLVHVYGTVLTANGEVNLFSRIVLVAVIINIILNLMLVRSHGALGSCYAALASQWFCGLACMYSTRKLLSISPRSFITYIFIALLTAVYYYVAHRMNVDQFLTLIAGLVFFITLLLLSKLFNLKNLTSQND